MIVLEKLSFRYPKTENDVLSGLSGSFSPGECVAVTGKNGCGKTTMVRLICGILRPTAGKITVDGGNTAKMDLFSIGRLVGCVFQDPSRQLFCTSVEEEVRFGLVNMGLPEEEIAEKTARYLKFFRLEHLAAAFPGTLGRPVLGRPATIERLTGARLRAFQLAHYIAPRIVVAVSGSFTEENLAHLAAHFSWLPARPDLTMRRGSYTPAFTLKRKAIEQNQISIGFPGLPTGSEARFTMALLSSILGGNMSSRLFQTVREKNGLCYAVYSYTAGFLDCGMFAVSAAVGRETEQRALALIRDELDRFRSDGVTQSELDRAREQVHASVLMAEESTAARMNKLGYSELYLGRVLPAEEVLARYDAVTCEDILGLARETLDFGRVSFSAVGRLRPQEEYEQLLKG